MKNISNRNEMSKLIDKYLIPQELEKKHNAEVSTPYNLRKEMINTIPKSFWMGKKVIVKNTKGKIKKIYHKFPKVFEPCSGKGGFLMDIIDKLMTGLKTIVPNENERYRIIVEKCLYFSDINPTNIFICKLLIDPGNLYSLNYNEGDTLLLDISEKWNINGFDVIIGNPPYNSSGDTGTGNTIWQYFTKMLLIIG